MATAVYRAADGREFASEEEATRHEGQIGKRATIEAFVVEHFKQPRLTKRYTNLFLLWEGYRDEVLKAV